MTTETLPAMTEFDRLNAQHIFDWARNSEPHCRQMRGLKDFALRVGSTTAARQALSLAVSVYHAMVGDRGGLTFSAQSILAASVLFLDWDGEE